MGLMAEVYRQVDRQLADGTAVMLNCTNNGWSGRFNHVCVTNIGGGHSANKTLPGVVLVQGPGPRVNPIIMLEDHYRNGVHAMFGGNFLFTSDSRWTEALNNFLGGDFAAMAVRIHDRVEP